MQIITSIERKKYLRELRGQTESWFAFGQRRFTGIVLGNFICITSHSGYEWDRRFTCHKNRAIGFVKETDEGCKVSVITTAGFMDPISILLLYGSYLFAFTYRSGQFTPDLTVHIFAIVSAVISAVISYVVDSCTQRGRESYDDLVVLLQNPVPVWEECEE